MTMKPRHEFVPCVPGAFRGGLSRTDFYDGMVLSEADMKREQHYWAMKRRLTNRALGQGVVWGLSLEWDERSKCFTLCPGYGISCCGADLVVECPEKVCEGDLIDPCSEEFREILKAAIGPCADPCDRRPDDPVEACLLLEYVECPENPRQVFEDPCAELPGGCRFGAVRETTRLRLVPPPPPPPAGPLERFCAKIDDLKKMLDQAGLGTAAWAALAAADMPADLPSIGVVVTLADENNVQLNEKRTILPGQNGQSVTLGFESPAARRLSISLVPPLGYGFLETREAGGDVSTVETLMELAYVDNDITDDGDISRNPTVLLAPLAGGDAYEVTYMLRANHTGATTTVSAEIAGARKLDRVPDCSTLMKGWVFNTDPACAVKTLLLAALCGWFKGLLGTTACSPEQDLHPTRVAIAWLVCWLAWRLLWKIDIREDQAMQAERCLKKLFEEWCAEFHYKGPRCEHYKHGIILGCVQVDPKKGTILCFDEWKHRRYVLTGPLLTHWTGLFGIAPLDVMATRLASWICCVARSPQTAPNIDDLTALLDQISANDDRLGIGGGFSIDTDFTSSGVFSGFNMRGSIRPAEAEARSEAVLDAQLGRRVEARIEASPAVFMTVPTMELIREVADVVPLSSLKSVGEETAFDAAVAAMERAELETAGDLLSVDADATARRLSAAMVADAAADDLPAAMRAVALVQKAAIRTLESAVDAVVAVAKERDADDVLTRADLAETGTSRTIRNAVNGNLKGNKGLSATKFNRITKMIAER